jgi:hypothetical protein
MGGGAALASPSSSPTSAFPDSGTRPAPCLCGNQKKQPGYLVAGTAAGWARESPALQVLRQGEIRDKG